MQISLGGGRKMSDRLADQDIDNFDLAILRELQRDNKTPQRLIAEAVGLSAPAVQRRIQKLEECGAIQANVAVIDPSKVGQPITLVVAVEMESEHGGILDAAKASFAAAPEIQQCYYVTGEIDFMLVVIVPSMADYEALTKRLFFANNNVKKFRTSVAMDRVKVGLTVPVG